MHDGEASPLKVSVGWATFPWMVQPQESSRTRRRDA